MLLEVHVHRASIGRPAGYVYILVAPTLRALYVGETLDGRGALGRLSTHLSVGYGNTFVQRLSANFGVESLDAIGTVKMYAWRLSLSRRSFHSRHREHREAVEYLVQYGVIAVLSESRMVAPLISRVRANGYVSLGYVREEARRCVAALERWVPDALAFESHLG